MKNLYLSILLLVSTLFVSCSKVPFVEKDVRKDASLVYVYTLPAYDSERFPKYKISINGKTTKGNIRDNEYTSYDLKSGAITFKAARNDVEWQELSMTLEAGSVYYLRIQSISDDFAKFTFTQVNEVEALAELESTNIAGEYNKADSIIDALIPEDEDAKKSSAASGMTEEQINALIEKKVAERASGTTSTTQATPSLTRTGSKLDDIRNAYEMKNQGLLSDSEFKAMKAEILAK